jgi:hypothetical protein
MAGDISLIASIQTNAVSTAPLSDTRWPAWQALEQGTGQSRELEEADHPSRPRDGLGLS